MDQLNLSRFLFIKRIQLSNVISKIKLLSFRISSLVYAIKISIEPNEQTQDNNSQSKQNNRQLPVLIQSPKIICREWKCYKGHVCNPVSKIGRGRNMCNICRYQITSELFLRCVSCNFDICEDCHVNQEPQIVQKMYPVVLQRQEIWLCGNRHRLLQTSKRGSQICSLYMHQFCTQISLCCQKCQFDVCKNCWRTKYPGLVAIMYGNIFQFQRCKKSHQMKPIHRYNCQECDVCGKFIKIQPFLGCSYCEYYVCLKCNLNQVSRQITNNEPIENNVKIKKNISPLNIQSNSLNKLPQKQLKLCTVFSYSKPQTKNLWLHQSQLLHIQDEIKNCQKQVNEDKKYCKSEHPIEKINENIIQPNNLSLQSQNNRLPSALSLQSEHLESQSTLLSFHPPRSSNSSVDSQITK